jgi:hypothetical protein
MVVLSQLISPKTKVLPENMPVDADYSGGGKQAAMFYVICTIE